jgi:drug/metabolite transporter (DMT)-like permease
VSNIKNVPKFAIPLLIALYFFWGATYLGIRVAVETIPPFYVGALRYLFAGVVMLVILKARNRLRASAVEIKHALIMGVLTAGISNGAMIYSEKTVESGIVAIAFTCMPLFLLLFNAVAFEKKAPSTRDGVLLLVGFTGTALVLSAGDEFRGVALSPFEWSLLVGCPFFWALGSLWGRSVKMPSDILVSATFQVLGGGVALLLAGGVEALLFGGWDPTTASLPSIAGVVYLATFGTLLGYTIFAYLINSWDPQVVGTYAFVCPIVAISLGVLWGERFASPQVILGSVFVISSVALRVLLAIGDKRRMSFRSRSR